jgi:hypothetical protein
MKKTIKLTESDIHRLIKKVINEQKVNDTPKKRWDDLVESVKIGKCSPVDISRNQLQIKCNDGTYYYIEGYRKFGQ